MKTKAKNYLKPQAMNKLTIEHLGKHLAFGLKIMNHFVNDEHTFEDDKISELVASYKEKGITIDHVIENQFKPILRPLSDLTKELLPFELSWGNDGLRFEDYFVMANNSELSYTTKVYDWLLKNHYDIDNLIGKGLAIDVNTLEENPYK